MQVTFYGLQAEALMGAHVFEEAYNLVLHQGQQQYGGQGKAASILDYRCALYVFEEAYNLVLHQGQQQYGGKGKAASILDYRCALYVFEEAYSLVLHQGQQQYGGKGKACLLYTSPSPRDRTRARMPSSA